jgi:hypothetical protein
MSGPLPISFIEEKVKDLGNALFISMSDAVLKIPTCVVKLLETDALGQLWFVIPKPSQYIHAFDKNFPVKLDFFRKGCDFYLKILGHATLVNDPEEINTIECLYDDVKEKARQSETILVRVKVSSASYTEKHLEKTTRGNFVHQVKNNIYRWFQSSGSGHDETYRKVPAGFGSPAFTNNSN